MWGRRPGEDGRRGHLKPQQLRDRQAVSSPRATCVWSSGHALISDLGLQSCKGRLLC